MSCHPPKTRASTSGVSNEDWNNTWQWTLSGQRVAVYRERRNWYYLNKFYGEFTAAIKQGEGQTWSIVVRARTWRTRVRTTRCYCVHYTTTHRWMLLYLDRVQTCRMRAARAPVYHLHITTCSSPAATVPTYIAIDRPLIKIKVRYF